MHNARLTLHIITFPEGQSAKWLDRQKMTLYELLPTGPMPIKPTPWG